MQMNERYELKEHGKVYHFFNRLCKNPYVLIAPALIFCLALTIYPMIYGGYLSFHKVDFLKNRIKFVGWNNYSYLFHSEDFLKTVKNTLIYMVVTVFVGLSIKVVLGVFLNKRTFAHNLTQTVMFTPHIISTVSIAVIFMWLMNPDSGILNYGLELLGLPRSNWHLSKDTALGSVLFVEIWRTCGYGVLMVIAGMRSIPEYLFEAAKLDKAGPVKTFFHITIPLLSPTLLFLVVTTTTHSFTTFDTIKLMTNGGPDNATNLIAYYVYQQGMLFMQYGRAMAAAMILLLFTACLSAINFFVLDKRVHYQ